MPRQPRMSLLFRRCSREGRVVDVTHRLPCVVPDTARIVISERLGLLAVSRCTRHAARRIQHARCGKAGSWSRRCPWEKIGANVCNNELVARS